MTTLPDPSLDRWALYGPRAATDWRGTFDGLVGLLTRSAIDAYVCSIPLSHGDHYRVVGDHYEAENPRWAWIDRPAYDGHGGGHDIPNPNAAWQDGMDSVPPVCAPPGDSRYVPSEVSECDRLRRIGEIRTEVDKIVDPWRVLPNPQDIAVVVDLWRAIFLDLCDRAEQPDTGAGSLCANLRYVRDTLEGRGYLGARQESSMIETFKSYVGNLRVAVDSCQDIALVLWVALAGEQGIWDCARQDFVSVISLSIEEFDRCAWAGGRASGGFTLSQTFTVAGVVASVVGLFTGPAGAAVATGVSLGSTFASEAANPKGEVSKEDASDYWSLLDGLKKLLGDATGLSGRIRREEEYVRGGLDATFLAIESGEGRKKLDPRAEPIISTAGIIRTDPALTDYIIETLMPAVGSEFDRISQSVGSAARAVSGGQTDILRRDSLAGAGPTGPTDSFGDLAYRLKSALGELYLEVDFGARNLRAAANELEHSNDAAKVALTASAAQASEINVSLLSSSAFSLWRGSDDG